MNNIITFAFILILSLFFGRVAGFFRIPKVTGFLLTGILMGPSVTGGISRQGLADFAFFSDFALGLIAFYIGCEFEFSHFKRLKGTLFRFSIGEITATLLIVFLIFAIVFQDHPAMALLLSILAVATAPAATFLVIREYDSEGPLTDHILAMVGINNLMCIIFFAIILTLVSLIHPPEQGFLLPALVIGISRALFLPLILGVAIALFWHFYLRREPESNELLLISLACIMLGSGLSDYFSVSPILTGLVTGAVLINVCDRTQLVLERIKQIDYPFYAIFFVLAGASLHLESFTKMLGIGGIYIIARITGKLIGAYAGVKWAGAARPGGFYLGIGLLSQAGLAIGLSSWATNEIPALGDPLQAIILSTTVIFELIGPVLTKYSLVKEGEVRIIKLLPSMTAGNFKAELHLLIDRIRQSFGMTRNYMKTEYKETVKIRHLMRYHIDTIPSNAPLDKIVKILEWSRYSLLPVVNEGSDWVGVISLSDIRDLFLDKNLGALIIAQDIARDIRKVSPDYSIEKTLALFKLEPLPYLPVLEQGKNHFMGVIHHRDICLFRLDQEKKAKDLAARRSAK